MNLNQLINMLNVEDGAAKNNKGVDRRDFFRSVGKGSLMAVPAFVLASLPKVSRAQSSSVAEVLNFALTLEYLEDEFYKLGLAAAGLIPAADRAIFTQIGKHESAHVAFLKTALGSAAVGKPTFDFTAGGTFPGAFTDYATFLALSQSFEDTGVRAYKGQAGALISDNNTLKAALQIHSVEGRHASEVRRLRASVSGQAIKGWISGKESNGAPAAIYEGEENVTHGTASLNSISSLGSLSANAKTEAFDEPLTKAQVLAIVAPFIV
jgi:Ferritin-like domain